MLKALWAVGITLAVGYSLLPEKKAEEVHIESCTLYRVSAYRQKLECTLSDGRTVEPFWGARSNPALDANRCYGLSSEGCYGLTENR